MSALSSQRSSEKVERVGIESSTWTIILFITASIFIIVFTELSQAQLFARDHFDFSEARSRNSYVVPNEENFNEAEPVLKRAGSGLYVSVGTERGFFGAGLVEGIDHLLLLDIDPNVVKFNRTNIALLRAARDKEHYLYLRHKASYEDLVELVGDQNSNVFLREEDKAILTNADDIKLWQSYMKKNTFSLLASSAVVGATATLPFGTNIYLRNDNAFVRIHELARSGRIEAHQVGLHNADQIEEVVDRVGASGLKLSVLDVSNAWWPRYMSIEAFQNLVLEFARVSHDDSLLFMSHHNLISHLMGTFSYVNTWFYFGLSFKEAIDIHSDNSRVRAYRWLKPYLTKGERWPNWILRKPCVLALKALAP